MSLQEDWNKTLADAKKVLGNSAKIPTGKMAVVFKSVQDAQTIAPGITAARDAFSKKILDMQNVYSKVKNALREASNEVSDDDYDLDEKKPEDKKKIDQAEAIFKKFFDSSAQKIDNYIKMLDEIDKHMEHARKFTVTKA
jgi:hypothetical protein